MDSHQRGHQYENNTVSGSARAHFGDVYNTYGETAQRETAETRCLRALFLTNPVIDRQSLTDRKGERVAGTCEWILKDETYKMWLQEPPSLLWIRGGPGKGKTMLSIYITHVLEQEHKNDVMYFFCNSLDEKHSKATAVLRSLIWQIISKRPNLTQVVLPFFEEEERTQAVLETKGELWKMFTSLLKQAEVKSMYCVIDGFDECDDASIHWLALQLATLSRPSEGETMRIALVSRDLPDLWHVEQRILIDPNNNDKINNDIAMFTMMKMRELSGRLDLSEDFVARIKDELLQKSEATFLWIGNAVNELLTKKSRMQVQETVHGLPVELGSLYSRMLYSVPTDKAGTVALLLCWVVTAMRPLSLIELAAAIEQDIPQHVDCEQAASDFATLCKPLVTVQGETVTLVHQSVKDYLLRQDEDVDPTLEKFRVKAADAHLLLAETCLSRLGGNSALAAYACSYWPDHARRCANNEQLLIARNKHFFAKRSELREQWWIQYIKSDTGNNHHVRERDDWSRLDVACYLGLQQWTECILTSRWRLFRSRRSRVNKETREGHMPLHAAIFGGHASLVQYLLTQGADPNLGDISVLGHVFVEAIRQDLMELLLTYGGSLDLFLAGAVFMHDAKTMDITIKRGANPNGAFVNGQTLIGFSVMMFGVVREMFKDSRNPPKVPRLLMEAGADPSIRDMKGKTAIEYVKEASREEIQSLFEEFGYPDCEGQSTVSYQRLGKPEYM